MLDGIVVFLDNLSLWSLAMFSGFILVLVIGVFALIREEL